MVVSMLLGKILKGLAKDHPEDFDSEYRKLRTSLIAKE
jgi:hypothetical protein